MIMARLPKISKGMMDCLILEAFAGGNPYKKEAIEFGVDRKRMYIWHNEVFSGEQMDKEYRWTAEHDITMGYKDRMVGYYDKWYRYNRADEGRAYDIGVKLAAENENCEQEMRIIPCMA